MNESFKGFRNLKLKRNKYIIINNYLFSIDLRTLITYNDYSITCFKYYLKLGQKYFYGNFKFKENFNLNFSQVFHF